MPDMGETGRIKSCCFPAPPPAGLFWRMPDPEGRGDYSIVRMSLKPVTSKISMMTSPTPVTFMVP